VNPSHVLVDEAYTTGTLAESPLAVRGPVDPRATSAAVLALGQRGTCRPNKRVESIAPSITGRISIRSAPRCTSF